MIRYVRHADIDKDAWNARLMRCTNKLWYGLSSTLDAAAPGWDALIDEEAGSQLALPWRRKFGFTYLYQPFLIQQLGPFSPSPSPDDSLHFIDALPGHFRFADICLCAGNARPREDRDETLPRIREQQNITLQLGAPIAEFRSHYSENHRRNLKKTEEAANGWDASVPLDELIAFLRGSDQFKRWGIDGTRIATMQRVMQVATERNEGFACGVRSKGALVAGAFFVRWDDRLIFLKGIADERGRELRAMHYLIDRVIADHTGHNVIFDFAGTNDPDLARFYLGFGAERSVYLRALVNRLPPILRMLKA